jgi:hypothetical protein
MKKLFTMATFATMANKQEDDAYGLYEALKNNPEALKEICKYIYEAKADYEHIKKFF